VIRQPFQVSCHRRISRLQHARVQPLGIAARVVPRPKEVAV
jgi:hypothetical protein